MKERPLSTNEAAFVLEAIRNGDEDDATRLDGRHKHEHRQCQIQFLGKPGYVEVNLGKTK